MRQTVRSIMTVVVCLVIPLVVLTQPATARWRVANGNDASEMAAPPGGTEKQTCSDQLRGATGWTTFVLDVSDLDPLPGGALTGVNYEVWKAPPGFDDFGEAQVVFDTEGNRIGYNFIDPNTFDEIPATSVVNFTTVPRTELVTPIPLNLDADPGDVFVFSAAPITQALPGVSPGNVLGIKPTGGASFITLKTIECSATGDYVVSDFFGPVDDPNIVNTGNAGDSYVVRFRLRDAQGDTVTKKSAVAAVTQAPTDCQSLSGRPTDAIEQSTTGVSRLRFSAAKDQFIYRWDSPDDVGCYKLKFIYDSGQHKQAVFNLS